MTEWQPIETAPRDGTGIITYPHFRVTHWIDGDEAIDEKPGWAGRWDEDFDCYWLLSNVSHWMPLPEPPRQG